MKGFIFLIRKVEFHNYLDFSDFSVLYSYQCFDFSKPSNCKIIAPNGFCSACTDTYYVDELSNTCLEGDIEYCLVIL